MSWDSPEVIVAGAVGLLSVAIAVWSVIVSMRANARASKANQNADHANRLADEANSIAKSALEHQQRYAPSPWGPVERDGDRKFRVENRSGRAINVLELTARPGDSADAVIFRSSAGSLIDYGDALHFLVDPSITQNPQEIEVAWVYADETAMKWEYLYRTIPPR